MYRLELKKSEFLKVNSFMLEEPKLNNALRILHFAYAVC